jgi:hypothetical protein
MRGVAAAVVMSDIFNPFTYREAWAGYPWIAPSSLSLSIHRVEQDYPYSRTRRSVRFLEPLHARLALSRRAFLSGLWAGVLFPAGPERLMWHVQHVVLERQLGQVLR